MRATVLDVDADLARLNRLITFLPYNVVEALVVDGTSVAPHIQWVDGVLLTVEFSAVPPRYERRGAAAADEEASRAAQELSLALRRILEEAVFPRGGYLLKFSPSGALVMFTARAPGTGATPWAHSTDVPAPAHRAARAAVEMLHILRSTFPTRMTMRAGAELGRFRLALCGSANERLEQLVLGRLCTTVASLRDAAGPGELVVGPAMVTALTGWQAHIGPIRAAGRRLINVPSEVAGAPARVADLQTLLALNAPRYLAALRPLLPKAVRQRVEGQDSPLGAAGEVRPVAVAAFPLEVDYPDDAEDSAVLLDLSAGVNLIHETVEANGGTLLQLDVLAGGAAAVCVFGLQETARVASRRALGCALQLSSRLNMQGARWSMRAGLESGRAYVGDVGSPLKRELAVVGGPAVVALDLAGHAARGQVLVGETAWRLQGGRAVGHGIGTLSVGRPPKSWGVYEATGLRREDHPMPSTEPSVDEASDQSPRARLGTRLSRLLQHAQATHRGAAAILYGPAGCGSSDLANGLAEEAARLGFRGGVVHCPAELALSPPPPLAILLREALGLPRAMPVDVLPPDVRDLVKAEMGPEAHVPLWLWKMLGITNLPEEDAAADASLDPPDALEVLCRLLRARAARAPVLLVLEDLHRVDHATLAVFCVLCRHLLDAPVVLLATATHDPAGGLPLPAHISQSLQRTGARWFPVPPMAPSEAVELLLREVGVPQASWLEIPSESLAADLGSAGLQPGLVRARAGAARARMAQGASFQEAWADVRECQDARELWQLRLDTLAPDARELLRLCAVVGEQFEAVLLWRALQKGPGAGALSDVMGRLAALAADRLLLSTVVGGVAGYRFCSPLLRDVAYRSWPAHDRARWHALTAQALAQIPWSEPTGGVARVAWHLLRSPDASRAVAPLQEAAAHMQSLNTLEEAASLMETALAQGGGAGPALQLATVELARGRFLDADRVASGVADDMTAPVAMRGAAWLYRTNASLLAQDLPGAVLASRTGRRLLPRGTQHALRTALAATHAEALWQDGKADQALLYLEQVDAQLTEEGTLNSPADTLPQDVALHAALIELGTARAGALSGRGQRNEAVRLLDLLIKRAALVPLHACGALARHRLGRILLQETPETAARTLVHASDVLAALGNRFRALAARVDAARAWRRAGQVDAAKLALDVVLFQAHLVGGPLLAMAHALHAALHATSDPSGAAESLHQAAVSLEGVVGRARVEVLTELARGADALGRDRDAVQFMEEARGLVERLGGPDLKAALDGEITLRGAD